MNDLIRLAMERAVDRFGGRGDNLFNGAGFSQEFCALAKVNACLDGHIVRAMLTGRPDVEPMWGGSHYKLKPRKPGGATCEAA